MARLNSRSVINFAAGMAEFSHKGPAASVWSERMAQRPKTHQLQSSTTTTGYAVLSETAYSMRYLVCFGLVARKRSDLMWF
jgi:hypothetical protein